MLDEKPASRACLVVTRPALSCMNFMRASFFVFSSNGKTYDNHTYNIVYIAIVLDMIR